MSLLRCEATQTSVLFIYWGRRGALSQFTLEVAAAAIDNETLRPLISVSRQNENFAAFSAMSEFLLPVNTFERNSGAVLRGWTVPFLRSQIIERVRRDRVQAVIALMPHVWTPFVSGAIQKAGARYVTVVHDAVGHWGDRTALVRSLLQRDLHRADVVVTLSSSVAGRLEASGSVDPSRLVTLFHPDMDYGARCTIDPPTSATPWRLLFLGRILPYKGLPILIQAVEALVARGHKIHLGIFGEGNLDSHRERLDRLNAEVLNRWLTEREILEVLSRFHTMVLPHVEASQSGVAATALGAGMPVVANPVGGIPEQIIEGSTGFLSRAAEAGDLADALERSMKLSTYLHVRETIARNRSDRTMATFTRRLVAEALAPR